MERTKPVKLSDGTTALCIDPSETPPPPRGYLRCQYCGTLRPDIGKLNYVFGCQHDGCPTGVHGQAFMGPDWGCWKK
jgi:hypothetical protein